VIVSHDDRLREVADRVLWLEDGALRSLQALVRDPVCGMLIDPEQAPASIERDGTRLHFCSRGCRDEFQADSTPTGYIEP
jgi:putative ABC transport system ATP-binding protein